MKSHLIGIICVQDYECKDDFVLIEENFKSYPNFIQRFPKSTERNFCSISFPSPIFSLIVSYSAESLFYDFLYFFMNLTHRFNVFDTTHPSICLVMFLNIRRAYILPSYLLMRQMSINAVADEHIVESV